MHDEPDSDVWARWRRTLRKHWQRRVLSRVYRPWLDTGGWRGCVVLASSPRSGSTWVFELLNQNREFRAIFEPFHPSRVPMLRAASYREYRRRDERCPELEAIFARLFAGELSNRWMDRFNRRWVSARRLVKTVRSNLVLPWLAERFPSMPLVLLLRHPCAVAASRKRLRWGTNVAPLLAQPKLCQDYLGPHVALMQSADTFEREIYRWAVSQLVPLSLLKRGQALTHSLHHNSSARTASRNASDSTSCTPLTMTCRRHEAWQQSAFLASTSIDEAWRSKRTTAVAQGLLTSDIYLM